MLQLPSVSVTAVKKIQKAQSNIFFLVHFLKQLEINTSTPNAESKCFYLFNVSLAYYY